MNHDTYYCSGLWCGFVPAIRILQLCQLLSHPWDWVVDVQVLHRVSSPSSAMYLTTSLIYMGSRIFQRRCNIIIRVNVYHNDYYITNRTNKISFPMINRKYSYQIDSIAIVFPDEMQHTFHLICLGLQLCWIQRRKWQHDHSISGKCRHTQSHWRLCALSATPAWLPRGNGARGTYPIEYVNSIHHQVVASMFL